MLLADLAGDYQGGAAGQTSDDIPLTGTAAGSWHYLSDTNANPTDGGLVLLTHKNVGLLGGTGYAGTGTVFGNCCGPFPIISNDGLFDGILVPPAGHVAVHPGSAGSTPPEFLAVEYRTSDPNQVLRKLTLDYRFDNRTGGDGTRFTLLDNRGRIFDSGAVNNSVDTAAGVATPTLRPGESLWLVVDNGPTGDNPGGDQTFVQLSVQGEVAGLIADLATDYRTAAAGQTSSDVGITGTNSGIWSYFSDTDSNPLNGGLALLTFGPVGLQGGDGYKGTGTVFGNPGCCGPFPIISDDGLFDGVTTLPPGVLAAHPGGQGLPPDFLVLQFEATQALSDLVLTYELENPGAGGDGIDYQILDDTGAILASGLLDGARSGLIDLDLADMVAGQRLYLVLGNGPGSDPATDQTFISLTLSGNIVPVPEPATAALGLIGLASLFARRRRVA
ncbi:MAG: PEP-CTERM sorting domain-containing protein [Phycisphaeraceae bacterium]